jgi:N-acetylneuraminate synthase
MPTRNLSIAGYEIGPGRPCFIIAEAGVNHNGDLALAHRLVDAAAATGANAVKFQTFKTERLVTAAAPKAQYQVETTGAAESQFDMLRRLELPAEAHRALLAHCADAGILFLSSAFDEESTDLLAALDVAAFKIGSGEITNWPLLEYIAAKGKPIILSTGMAYLGEVDAAVRAIRAAGCEQLALLHCLSSYPADPAEVNLRAMHTLAAAFGLPVGYSDHSLSMAVPLAAVALGACIIEKHFTLDKNLPGPDQRASADPAELAALVQGTRTIEAALGHGRKEPAPSEADTANVARKSLVAARDLPAGATLTAELIAIKRPGTGLPPSLRSHLVGRRTRVDVPAGALLTLEMLA